MEEDKRTSRVVVVRGRIGFLRPARLEDVLRMVRDIGRRGEGKAEGQG